MEGSIVYILELYNLTNKPPEDEQPAEGSNEKDKGRDNSNDKEKEKGKSKDKIKLNKKSVN